MLTNEITIMELMAVKEALDLSSDELQAAEFEGFVLTTGASEAVGEALIIVNAIIDNHEARELEAIMEEIDEL